MTTATAYLPYMPVPGAQGADTVHLPDVCRIDCEHVAPVEVARHMTAVTYAQQIVVGDFVRYIGTDEQARRAGVWEVVDMQPMRVVLAGAVGQRLKCQRGSIVLAESIEA